MKIEKYLLESGIRPQLKGFDFIVEAVNLCRNDRSYLHSICARLYPAIADKYGSSSTKVERAIRHSISTAGIKMTNSQFIAFAEIETR